MGVPKEIREVERPTNTIVCDNGKDTPFRYAVRERAASGKYVRGKFPLPKNGKVIGHIINFKYVPWSKGLHGMLKSCRMALLRLPTDSVMTSSRIFWRYMMLLMCIPSWL